MVDTTPSDSDQKAITAVVNAFFTYLDEQNYDGIDSLFHEDGTMWDVFDPRTFRGAKQRYELWEADRDQFTSRGKFTWSVNQPDIDMWGDNVAVCRYHLTFDFAPPNAASGYLRITDVVWREAGGWKIVHHYEAPAPAGPPPTDEPRPR